MDFEWTTMLHADDRVTTKSVDQCVKKESGRPFEAIIQIVVLYCIKTLVTLTNPARSRLPLVASNMPASSSASFWCFREVNQGLQRKATQTDDAMQGTSNR